MRFSFLFASLSMLASCVDLATDSPDDSPEVRTGTFDTPRGRVELTYEVIDGWAVYQGDIGLGPVDEISEYTATRTDLDARWPSGIIPYDIGSGFSSSQRADIVAAIAHWNTSTPYRLVQHNGQSDSVKFVTGTGPACVSQYLGRHGGQQLVTLPTGCLKGQIIHEIGHVAGLWHEQARADRGNYINIIWANIPTNLWPQFQTYEQQGFDGQDLYNFDFNSIMLYGSTAFGSGKTTMTKKDGSVFSQQLSGLSDLDIAGATNYLTYTPGQTGVYNFVSANSGLCLALQAPARARNVQLTQQTCNYFDLSQRWYFYNLAASGTNLLVNALSGQCVDVPNASTTAGTWLQQFPCHGRSNQVVNAALPTVTSNPVRVTIELFMQNSGMCLDVADASRSPGAHVNQFPCRNSANQRWTMAPVITD